jgi:hypothetical protein
MAVNQGILRKYQSRLASIPVPGGNGCHPTLLAVANMEAWPSLKVGKD